MAKTGRGRGFNAAKKGSKQVGFQPAPPVNPEVPTAVEDMVRELQEAEEIFSDSNLDEVYEKFLEQKPHEFSEYSSDDGIGLSLEEQVSVLEARQKLSDSTTAQMSLESSNISRVMAKEWGLSSEQISEATSKTNESLVVDNDYYEYLDASDAHAEVASIVEGPPFYGKTDGEIKKLLSKIESADLLLSRSDISQISRFRDEAYLIHSRDTSPDRTQSIDADWISASVQRKCELCGQFISTRDSHGSFSYQPSVRYNRYIDSESRDAKSYCDANPKTIHDFGNDIHKASSVFSATEMVRGPIGMDGRRIAKKLKKITPLNDDEILFSIKEDSSFLSVLDVKKNRLSSEYSPEFIEDVYMRGDNRVRDYIVALHAEKKGFGDKKTVFVFPQNMREAIVEAPPFASPKYSAGALKMEEEHGPLNGSMMILAARIEPPFTDGELKRIIDQGDVGVVKALLSVKRTQSVAEEIITNYPSEGSRSLALRKGGLRPFVLSSMSFSPNPTVRAYAASSPDLSIEDALTLAEDPDPLVRRSLIVPRSKDNEKKEKLFEERQKEPGTSNDDSETSMFHRKDMFHREWSGGGDYAGDSALRRNVDKVGGLLINDPDPEIAVLAFSSLSVEKVNMKSRFHTVYERGNGLSNKQKFLVSKIKTRKRFNELKKYVLANPTYDTNNPDVAKLLAH